MTQIYRVFAEVRMKPETKEIIMMQTEGHVTEDNLEDAWEESVFEIGAEWYLQAVTRAIDILEGKEGKGNFEIFNVDPLDDIEVINWGQKDQDYYYMDRKTHLEDKIIFNCPKCNVLTEVTDGWEKLECRECGFTFERVRLIEVDGSWTYLKQKKIVKKRKDKNIGKNISGGDNISGDNK